MTEQSFIAGTATGPAAPPTRLSQAAVTYAEQIRKVSRATLERLGVGSSTAFFPEINRESEAVYFPYRASGGEVVNWKAAAFPIKSFTSKKGGKLQFWNLDRALGSACIYITEGEWDAASLIEARFRSSRSSASQTAHASAWPMIRKSYAATATWMKP